MTSITIVVGTRGLPTPDSATTMGDRAEDWFNRWIRPYVER